MQVEFPLDWAKGQELVMCPVCESDFKEDRTVGKLPLLHPSMGMVGWACSKCSSKFDNNNNLMMLSLPKVVTFDRIAS